MTVTVLCQGKLLTIIPYSQFLVDLLQRVKTKNVTFVLKFSGSSKLQDKWDMSDISASVDELFYD